MLRMFKNYLRPVNEWSGTQFNEKSLNIRENKPKGRKSFLRLVLFCLVLFWTFLSNNVDMVLNFQTHLFFIIPLKFYLNYRKTFVQITGFTYINIIFYFGFVRPQKEVNCTFRRRKFVEEARASLLCSRLGFRLTTT